MVDALSPALDVLITEGVTKAALAARRGADYTARLSTAKAGRSAYVSEEQLIGHIDPGAEAVARLFECLST
jgi:dihydroxyacetone kinase